MTLLGDELHLNSCVEMGGHPSEGK